MGTPILHIKKNEQKTLQKAKPTNLPKINQYCSCAIMILDKLVNAP